MTAQQITGRFLAAATAAALLLLAPAADAGRARQKSRNAEVKTQLASQVHSKKGAYFPAPDRTLRPFKKLTADDFKFSSKPSKVYAVGAAIRDGKFVASTLGGTVKGTFRMTEPFFRTERGPRYKISRVKITDRSWQHDSPGVIRRPPVTVLQ